MQLTRLDRWLRQKFVHETHVYTMRPPESLPPGVIAEELPEAPGRRFKHRFILRNEDAATAFIADLRNANLMFTTRVVDREEWYVPLIAPQGKSVTWWFIWLCITFVAVLGMIHMGRLAWANPELRENVSEAIEILKG